MDYAVGIDIGGTNIKTIAVTPQGELLFQSTVPTEDNRDDWTVRIRENLKHITAEQGHPAEWIGIAAPGLAAADGRSIAWMQGRLSAVQGLDWTDYLEASQPIPVLNDAHAALLGEVWQGSAKGCRDALLLTLGTGVGGGAMLEGRLLRGNLGRAGHLGHICLNPDATPDIVGTPGSLEDAIGDCTVRRRTGGRFTSTADLVQAHLAGDAEATTIWMRSVYLLACGIVSLINAFDPEVVILGGGIAAGARETLFTPLQNYMDAMEWRPTGTQTRIIAATLSEWAGAYGAAYHALRSSGVLL